MFAHFCCHYVNLNIASFLHKSQQLFVLKKQNSGKNQKKHMPTYS